MTKYTHHGKLHDEDCRAYTVDPTDCKCRNGYVASLNYCSLNCPCQKEELDHHTDTIKATASTSHCGMCKQSWNPHDEIKHDTAMCVSIVELYRGLSLVWVGLSLVGLALILHIIATWNI